MDKDTQSLETHVFVHSPLIEHCSNGNFYTSYAISLTSNNPCFTHQSSHTRRRYSEFLHLRRLLAEHHPSVTPPILPPKSFFQRFSESFIEERMAGLQKFLDQVLEIPVYLSDKSLHLFLQSSCSMSQIDEACFGDIPPPQFLDTSISSTPSDASSSKSNECLEALRFAKALQNLVIEHKPTESDRTTKTLLAADNQSSRISVPLVPAVRQSESRPRLIPKKNGSLDSSPSSSPSSSEASYSSSLEPVKQRHVSFNERVQVAIVTNYGISMVKS